MNNKCHIQMWHLTLEVLTSSDLCISEVFIRSSDTNVSFSINESGQVTSLRSMKVDTQVYLSFPGYRRKIAEQHANMHREEPTSQILVSE